MGTDIARRGSSESANINSTINRHDVNPLRPSWSTFRAALLKVATQICWTLLTFAFLLLVPDTHVEALACFHWATVFNLKKRASLVEKKNGVAPIYSRTRLFVIFIHGWKKLYIIDSYMQWLLRWSFPSERRGRCYIISLLPIQGLLLGAESTIDNTYLDNNVFKCRCSPLQGIGGRTGQAGRVLQGCDAETAR